MTKTEWQTSDQKNKPSEVQNPLSKSDPDYADYLQARLDMLEKLAECDESFMDEYLVAQESDDNDQKAMLDAPDLSSNVITAALRRACLGGAVVPAICGAHAGQRLPGLLDSCCGSCPPPDVPSATAVHKSNGKTRKISVQTRRKCTSLSKSYDKLRGPRVCSQLFWNSHGSCCAVQYISGEEGESNQLLAVSADDLDQIKELGPGQVGCLVGLKHTRTGTPSSPTRAHSSTMSSRDSLPCRRSLLIEPERSSQQSDRGGLAHSVWRTRACPSVWMRSRGRI